MTILKIARPKKKWQDRVRAYKILVDGAEVGEVRQLGEFLVPVAPGRHSVQFKIDWCCSPSIEIEVAEGATEVVACEPNAHPLLAFIYISFLRRRYIRVYSQKSDA
jgi:hypothetical protein